MSVTMREMLEAGVHFGHQTRFWNPKMAPYIFGHRNKIHIVNLEKTIVLYHDALKFVRQLSANKGSVLFVGTKRQAREIVKEEAIRSGSPYVDYRWLGGMLTNWSTIQKRIEQLKELEKEESAGNFELLSKKDYSAKRKEMDKLKRLFNGIKEMTALPDAVIFTNQLKDSLAIQECLRLGIPTISIVDTNCNPDMIPYPIPANDDSSSSINFILNYLVNRILTGYNSRKN